MITVAPRFRPVEFTATYSTATIQPVARRIAELASEVSDFEKGTPKRKRVPQA
jgi:hypothetical protein